MTAAASVETADAALWGALHTVRDPELDRPITDLEFVTEATVRDGRATVRLRLPTYFCSPNFAWMMTADAYDAAAGVPGVAAVDVRLEDHFVSDDINRGVAAQAGFSGAFADEAGGDLAELRATFLAKAHTASIDRVVRELVQGGVDREDIWEVRLGDLPGGDETERLLRRRSDVGLAIAPEQYLLVDDEGARIARDSVPAHLRFARSVRVSSEWNAGFCGSLVHTRYGTTPRATG